MEVLGIDIGGSGMKAAMVETDTGALLTDKHRIDTPQPATPDKMTATVRELAGTFDYAGTVGCCFPAVIADGKALTAGNLHESVRGMPVDKTFSEATGLPFVILNDADAAGIAEMRLGAGRGLDGMVITITIGTGLGSGVFYNGLLIPNIELGRMPGKDGEPIEFYSGGKAREDNNLGWDEFGERFNYFLERVTRIMAPDHFIIGGGASKHLKQFEHIIRVPVTIRPAQFLNNAGIVGAAVAAAN